MISDGTLEELECAISNDKHFLRQPIALSCGHCACRSCINLEIKKEFLECTICKELNTFCLDNAKESIATKKLIQSSLYKLLQIILVQLSKSLDTYTSKNARLSYYFLFNFNY